MPNNPKKMSIKNKLILVIFLTSFCVLLLENIGFIALERFHHKGEFKHDIDSFVRIISTRSAEPLAQRDEKAVQDILEIASIEKQIVAACIYDTQGKVFTRFDSGQEHAFEFPDIVNLPHITEIENDYLQISQPIMRDGALVGTVFIRASLQESNLRWYNFLLYRALMTVFASLIAYIAAVRLQRVVLLPLHRLSAKVHSIVINKTYTSRLAIDSNDEISAISNAFNHTFNAIDARDSALQRCHERLATFEQKIDYPADLLALASLHIAEGIEHNGGHIGGYRKQLFRFRKHFAQAVEQLRQILIEDQDLLGAVTFCNALKGVSGNIGAMSLFRFTSALANNLREGQALDENDFNHLNKLLNDVFSDIDSLTNEHTPQMLVKRNVSTVQLARKTKELLDSIEQDLGESEKLLTQLNELASGSEFEVQVKAIAVQIDEFNIEQATLLLTELQQRLLTN